LDNVIKKLENKHNKDGYFEEETPYVDARMSAKYDVVRSRKFKKAMNSFGSRQERIEMVKGLALGQSSKFNKDDQPKKNFNNGPSEDTESTMTHKEIEEFS